MSCLGGCISKEVWDRAEAMEDALLEFSLTEEGKRLNKIWLENDTRENRFNLHLAEYNFLKEKGFNYPKPVL